MSGLGLLLPPRRRMIHGILMALLGPAMVAAALLPLRAEIGTATAGLAFVVPVVLATALGGIPASVVAVAAGFLAYNVLFTLPYHTLAVAHAPDVTSLIVYVVVGAVTAVIVSLRQREATAALQREREAVAVFDLSRSLISEPEAEAVFASVVAGVDRLYDVCAVTVLQVAESDDALRVAAHTGQSLPEPVMAALTTSSDAETWSSALRGYEHLNLFPLPAGGRIRGALVVWGWIPDPGPRVLTAFANQAALALHRAELVRAATRLEVLEESDRVRAALIRSVSHDLRTPLSSIKAAAEDLCEPELALPDADREVLAATIAEEAGRLDHLVANLLDMGRLEAGRLEVHREAVDVLELVQAAAGDALEGLVLDIPFYLPPVDVDPLLMEQVFRNLLENARRFSPTPGSISIRGSVHDGRVAVAVRDRGPGVAHQDKDRIFELFHQTHPRRSPGGIGLGLAISRGYVEAHGGDIRVEDTPGGGATFVVALPPVPRLPDELEPLDSTLVRS